MAPLGFRVRRVMLHHWVREAVALNLIDQSDTERRQYFERHFQADWTDPLQYDWTVNSGRLDNVTAPIAWAAVLHW